MNRLARSGSTGFHVPPSTLRSEPTIAPSATARKSFTLLDFTPVFAKTGVSSPQPRFASRTASTDGSAPAIGPETRMASARLETRTDGALVAMSRAPTVEANSGEMLDIASPRFDDRRRTAGLVVQRCTRHRRQVRHRDGRLVDAEELLQVKRHFRI